MAAGLGLGAAVMLLGAATALPQLAAPAAVLLGTAYALVLAVDGGALDRRAPVVAAALLLSCELAFWAHELRTTSPDEAGARARHVAWLAALVLMVLLIGIVLLAVVDLARTEGVAIELAGTAAAVGAVTLLWRLARDAVRR